jgi:hypothetical protein
MTTAAKIQRIAICGGGDKIDVYVDGVKKAVSYRDASPGICRIGPWSIALKDGQFQLEFQMQSDRVGESVF